MMLWARFRRWVHLLAMTPAIFRGLHIHQAFTLYRGRRTTAVLCTCGKRWGR